MLARDLYFWWFIGPLQKIRFYEVSDCLEEVAVLFEYIFDDHVCSEGVLHVVEVTAVLLVVEHLLCHLPVLLSPYFERLDHLFSPVAAIYRRMLHSGYWFLYSLVAQGWSFRGKDLSHRLMRLLVSVTILVCLRFHRLSLSDRLHSPCWPNDDASDHLEVLGLHFDAPSAAATELDGLSQFDLQFA